MDVWTAPLAADLVKKLFGIQYHPYHMRRIFRRLRLTVQLPTRELYRADPDEQARWFSHELQAIKRVGQKYGVLIYEDEASFGQAGSLHRPWTRRGKGTHAKSFPGRKGARVMGAVRVGDNPSWQSRCTERYSTDIFTTFTRQLLRYYEGRKALRVVDNAPWHETKAPRKWLEQINDLIEVHFCPKYAPHSSTPPSISGRRLGNGLPTTASGEIQGD